MKIILKICLLISLFFIAGNSYAITLSNFTTGGPELATSITFAHNAAVGTDYLLVYAMGGNPITGITYNGVAMTKANSTAMSICGAYVWYLAAPDSGNHNVVVSVNSLSWVEASAGDVDGVSGLGTNDYQSGNSATPRLDFSSTIVGSTIVGSLCGNSDMATTDTERYNQDMNSSGFVGSSKTTTTTTDALVNSMTSGNWEGMGLEFLSDGSGGGGSSVPLATDSFEDLGNGSSIMWHGFIVLFFGAAFPVWFLMKRKKNYLM